MKLNILSNRKPKEKDDQLYLFLIWREGVAGYDEYEGAVVCASSLKEARTIHPINNDEKFDFEKNSLFWKDTYNASTWVDDPKDVHVKIIGKATSDMKKGVVLASFNAG